MAIQDDMALSGSLDFPVSELYIEITARCNMNCVFCPISVMKRPRQDMPHDMVMKILNELKELKKKGVSIPPVTFHCMGEPLLNRHLPEYMRFCDELGIYYWIVSNGLLFSQKRCEEFFSHSGLHHAELSFHTVCARTFSLRGVPKLSHESYMERVRNAVFSENRYLNRIPLQVDVMYDLNLENGRLFNAFRKKEWLAFAAEAQAWGRELEARHPEMLEQERKFYLNRHRKADLGEYIIVRNLRDLPDGLFAELPKRINWLSWEVVPGLLITVKKFFIFSPNDCYLKQITGSRPVKAVVEETNGFACNLSKQLVVLSDGRIVCCCLDYDGEGLILGKIEEMSLQTASVLPQRKALIAKPETCAYCRCCRGRKIFIWDESDGRLE